MLTATVTVVLASVVAHGVSAGPLAERYGRTHPASGRDVGAPSFPSRALSRRGMPV